VWLVLLRPVRSQKQVPRNRRKQQATSNPTHAGEETVYCLCCLWESPQRRKRFTVLAVSQSGTTATTNTQPTRRHPPPRATHSLTHSLTHHSCTRAFIASNQLTSTPFPRAPRHALHLIRSGERTPPTAHPCPRPVSANILASCEQCAEQTPGHTAPAKVHAPAHPQLGRRHSQTPASQPTVRALLTKGYELVTKPH
jgi:hypothetical protein